MGRPWSLSETYSESSQRSKMELFEKTMKAFQPFYYFSKTLHLRCLTPETVILHIEVNSVSGMLNNHSHSNIENLFQNILKRWINVEVLVLQKHLLLACGVRHSFVERIHESLFTYFKSKNCTYTENRNIRWSAFIQK